MRSKRHWYALWAQKWRVKGSDITYDKRHTNATRTHACTHPYPRCKNQIILEYKHFGYVFMCLDIKVKPSQEDQEWRRITRQSSRFSKHTGSCFHVLKFGFAGSFGQSILVTIECTHMRNFVWERESVWACIHVAKVQFHTSDLTCVHTQVIARDATV